MDVYLTEEAHSFLQAINMVKGDHDGLLLGHKRGHRFIVEKIFPTHRGFFSSQEQYIALNRHFGDRVIGFFSFNPDERKVNKILGPLAQGKLYLRINTQGDDTLDIQPFRIDFEDRFFLSPIRRKT
jgi:hypothetical protein